MSGFLVCAGCDSPLTMHGSRATNTYYCCATYKMKGICDNARSLRANAVRAELFAAIRSQVFSSDLIKAAIERQTLQQDHLKPRIEELQRELQTTEVQIKRIIACVTGGDGFEYLRLAMEKLELTARSQKAQLQELRAKAKRPGKRVSAKDVAAVVDAVSIAKGEAVEHAKERLRRWLDGGLIRFDGKTVEIEMSPSAIVADVSRGGDSPTLATDSVRLKFRVESRPKSSAPNMKRARK
jgi:hypothetical protein